MSPPRPSQQALADRVLLDDDPALQAGVSLVAVVVKPADAREVERAGVPALAGLQYAPASSAAPAAGAGRATGVPSAPPGGRPAPTPLVTVTNGTASVATVTPNAAGVAHVILAVTDAGTPSLTAYRRVVLTIKSPAGR